MQFEVQKYQCHDKEYLLYDCNRNEYEIGGREVKVMCSQSVGLETEKFIVGPIVANNDISVILYNPDGTKAEPQADDLKVFSKYLEEAGYDRTPRSGSGQFTDDEVRKVCKMAFYENFINKYNIRKEKEKNDAE